MFNLIGKVYNRLTVLSFSHVDKYYSKIYNCECICGNKSKVRSSALKNGDTKSCGCLRLEKCNQANTKHGMIGTKVYRAWAHMKGRCLNPDDQRYKDYGGRGIKVCKRWMKFENFYKDMGDPPHGKSLDRINNDGDYTKSNCKWSTPKEQANNRRA